MLREIEKRRPGFEPSEAHAPVILGGTLWFVSRPGWWIRPRFENGRCVVAPKVWGISRDVDALVEALAGVDDFDVQITIVASIAAELLNRHYLLSSAELDSLLCGRRDDPDSWEWVREVIAAATGREQEQEEPING